MERIETIDLKAETYALEAGHGITLYTFDEYDRLMHYAHIVASTPKERADGYSGYFLTIFKGGGRYATIRAGRWRRLSGPRIGPRLRQDHLARHAHLVGTRRKRARRGRWHHVDELRGADMLAAARRGSKTKCGHVASNRTANRPSRTCRPSDRPDWTPSLHRSSNCRGLHRRRGQPARRR